MHEQTIRQSDLLLAKPEQELLDRDEYGRPFFAQRRWALRQLSRASFKTLELSTRLLHPQHPYRVFMEGTFVLHRRLLHLAVIPTRPRRRTRLVKLGVIVVAVVFLSDFVSFLPGPGLFDVNVPSMPELLGLR